MSENADMPSDSTSGEELVSLLAQRRKAGRARSTTLLIAVLLVLLGVLIGVPLGRASAPQPSPTSIPAPTSNVESGAGD